MAFAIWLTLQMLESSMYIGLIQDNYFKWMRICCLAVACLAYLLESGSQKLNFFAISVALIMCLVIYKTGQGLFFDALLFVYCGRRIAFTRVAKVSLLTYILVFALIVASAKAGIILDYVQYAEGRVRHYLGFRYALRPSQYFFIITSLYVFLRARKLGLLDVIALIAANYYVFVLTNSRLSFFLSCLLVLWAFLQNRWPGFGFRWSLSQWLAGLSYGWCAALAIGLTVKFDTSVSWMVSLNSYLGNRLMLGKVAFETYGVPLFGQEITFVGNSLTRDGVKNTEYAYNVVDSLYVKLLIQYGVVFLFVYLALLTVLTDRIIRQGQYVVALVLVVTAFHMLIDELPLLLQYNPFLFAFSYLYRSEVRADLQAQSRATNTGDN